MTNFLLGRFENQGTLSAPSGVPYPAFALPATLNWMRALAILVKDEGIDATSMQEAFKRVTKGTLSDQAINTTFEQLLMSLHHLASLNAMNSLTTRIDTARSAIVTWYYGIFHASNAMISAQDGSCQEKHDKTAKAWDRQFSSCSEIPKLFRYRVSTLVKKEVEREIKTLRNGNIFDLKNEPTNAQEAFGACVSYLNGSAEWKAEDLGEKLKKKRSLNNFRTEEARKIRDAELKDKTFGFIHQAFRYRGKANYREALFISYGNHIEPRLANFHMDLFSVLEAFLCMAGAFCARRIGKDLWNAYHDDLSANVPLLVTPSHLWGKLS